jgi:chloride channel, nucleotide-sensitive, 1A
MPPTTIHSPPALDSFTPLAEHQSQTPTTFYNAKPVLHYHAVGLRAVAPSNNVSKLPIFPQSTGNPTESTPAEAASADPESQDSPASATVTEIVDAFISSE